MKEAERVEGGQSRQVGEARRGVTYQRRQLRQELNYSDVFGVRYLSYPFPPPRLSPCPVPPPPQSPISVSLTLRITGAPVSVCMYVHTHM